MVEAMANPKKDKWKNAMDKEIESLYKNVWGQVELLKDRKAVGSGYFSSRLTPMDLSNTTRHDLWLNVLFTRTVWNTMKHSLQ